MSMPRYEKALRCILALQRGEPVGVHWMIEHLRISRAQAKRDMLELERVLPLARERRGPRVVLVLKGAA